MRLYRPKLQRYWLESGALLGLLVLIVVADQTYAITAQDRFCLGALLLGLCLVLPGLLPHRSLATGAKDDCDVPPEPGCASRWGPLRRWGPKLISLGLLAMYGVALLCLRSVALSPVKPFVRLHQSIQPGMTVERVERLVDENFPLGGTFPRPTVALKSFDGIPPAAMDVSMRGVTVQNARSSVISYTLNPDDERYDDEVLTVALNHGRVIATDYVPD